jgi:hypothetical protein
VRIPISSDISVDRSKNGEGEAKFCRHVSATHKLPKPRVIVFQKRERQKLLSGSSKPRDCAIAGKVELPHGSDMKRKSIVSLIIATLAWAMQPARAQSADSNQDPPSAGYSSVVSTSTVRAVQLALQKAGYYVGKTDGEFTGDTRTALNEFERRNGLSETGTITPDVLKALGLS